jgi:hypothetical protein
MHLDPVLQPITDTQSVDETRQTFSSVVTRSTGAALSVVKREGWVAVPVESAHHLDDDDQIRLLRAVQAVKTRRVRALMLENLGDFPPAFDIQSSLAGIAAFNWECGHFNVALGGDDAMWIVACTTDDFYVIAGPAQFVTICVGGDIREAFDAFRAFATAPEWSKSLRAVLVSTLNSTEVEFANASAGTSVEIGRPL